MAPHIAELDRAHRFDPRILPQMADLGLLGVCVPPEYGGAGMDYISLGLASEELEYVDTSLRVILSVHVGLNCLSLLAWGTEDQKQRYLVPQAQGQKIATFGLTEPAAGSDARGIQTVADQAGRPLRAVAARRCGSRWPTSPTTSSSIAWSDLEKKKRAKDPGGLSAFIVERAFKGFSSGTLTHKWGILAGNTGFFKMDEVEVPAENLARARGRGVQDRDVRARSGPLHGGRRRDRPDPRLPRRERDVRAASATPSASRSASTSSSRRCWRGWRPTTRCRGCSGCESGWMKNMGRRNTKETGLAKWIATVASERAAGDAVQIHGANGYSDEYPVGRFYRNCKGAVIYEGTREIHALMQADYLLGYRTDKPTRCELPPYRGQAAHA